MALDLPDKQLTGGADHRLVEVPADHLSGEVPEGGVQVQIGFSVFFRDVPHQGGQFHHAVKGVGNIFLFIHPVHAHHHMVDRTDG